MATITKIDIAAVAEDLTLNIEDRLVDPHVDKAFDLDFTSVVPAALLTAIAALNVTSDAMAKPQLIAFYNTYFKKAWCHLSYVRFLIFHGNNVTQFGIVNKLAENTAQVDTDTRNYMVKNVSNDAQVYVARMQTELVTKNYTFDSTSYGVAVNETISHSFNPGIRGI